MATALDRTETTQIYRIFIQATPEQIWDAITKPEWNVRYGYRCPGEYDLRVGGAYRALANDEMRAHGGGEVVVDGEVVEVDPPRRLVQTWRATWLGEGFTKLTYEIEPGPGGVTSLTLIHELEGAPQTANQVAGATEGAGGGWAAVLSELKTLLETGEPMYR
jgi:uncharacterized protein YndB with AHSA1/START domain